MLHSLQDYVCLTPVVAPKQSMYFSSCSYSNVFTHMGNIIDVITVSATDPDLPGS